MGDGASCERQALCKESYVHVGYKSTTVATSCFFFFLYSNNFIGVVTQVSPTRYQPIHFLSVCFVFGTSPAGVYLPEANNTVARQTCLSVAGGPARTTDS